MVLLKLLDDKSPVMRRGACNMIGAVAQKTDLPDRKKGPVPAERKELVRRLLRERLSLRAIARAAGVSRSWLQAFVNRVYRDETPFEPGPLKKSRAN